jgi:xanthine dehydrogenase accessory factor
MAEHFSLSAASLARLRGPIGIYIGSKTPSEIAVSVMAEVLAVKNGVTLPRDMAVAQAKNDRAVVENETADLVCGIESRQR